MHRLCEHSAWRDGIIWNLMVGCDPAGVRHLDADCMATRREFKECTTALRSPARGWKCSRGLYEVHSVDQGSWM